MNNIKKVGAILLVILLAGLYIATFIMGVMGSDYIAAMLFLDVIIPVLCWGIALIARVLKRKGQDIRKEGAEPEDRQHEQQD
ncbi:MAG: hypothetical protein J6A82_02020 [Coprococcus sp.]|nr:hypothetical protein [Coprococcus sp.]